MKMDLTVPGNGRNPEGKIYEKSHQKRCQVKEHKIANCRTVKKKADYGTEGMCLGMCVGTAIGASLGNNTGLGISLGMLIGLAIGICIEKEERGEDNAKKE